MKRLLLYVITILIVYSCSHPTTYINHNVLTTIEMDGSGNRDTHWSEIVASRKYIPLETNSDCLIGSVQKILKSDGMYFVMSSTKQGQLFVFDTNGKYLTTIGRKGKGPGEYTKLVDFCIHPTKDIIYLLCSNHRVIQYSHTNKVLGEFKLYRSKEFKYFNPYAIACNDKYLVINNNEAFELVFYDLEGNYKGIDLKCNPIEKSSQLSPFHISGNGLFYYTEYNDTIYKIDDNSIVPCYFIDFGNLAEDLLKYERGKPNVLFPYKHIINESYDDKFLLAQSDRYLCFRVTHNNQDVENKVEIIFFNKHNREKFIIPYVNNNDELNISTFLPGWSQFDNTFTSFVYPVQIKDSQRDSNLPILDSLSQRVNIDDNPILIEYSL